MKAWLKKWWWTIALAIAGILAVLAWAIFRKPKKQTGEAQPSFSAKARTKIVEAETDLAIQKYKAEAQSEADKKELERIESVKDADERRGQLASYLENLL